MLLAWNIEPQQEHTYQELLLAFWYHIRYHLLFQVLAERGHAVHNPEGYLTTAAVSMVNSPYGVLGSM